MAIQLKIKISLFHSFIILISTGCLAQKNTQNSQKPQLIFKSGFEGNTQVATDLNSNDYGAKLEYISGNDNKETTSKGNWDKDWSSILSDGKMQVQYTGGDSSKRYVKVISEPGNLNNKVLKFWLDDSWLASENERKARVQTNIYGIKQGLKEIYQSVRVYVHEDFKALSDYPKPIKWLTISEFWNNEWWVKEEKFGFRITLGIGKYNAEDKDLFFTLNAEDAGQIEVWEEKNLNVKVPIGKWFTMDYYLKEGDNNTGRFYLAITADGGKKEVVYDIKNYTHNTKDIAPNGYTGYNPMKLYTSKDLVAFMKTKGKTLQIYWDDFELWNSKKPD